MKTAAFITARFMLYYSRAFGYLSSDSGLPQGCGYSGAVKANPDRKDKTLQSNRRWERVVAMSNEKKKSRMAIVRKDV